MIKDRKTSSPRATPRLRSEPELRELEATGKERPMMAELYRRAEASLRTRQKAQSMAGEPKTGADPRRLLHELEVHQIELEMQNAELRQVRDEMEAALENYTDLYDFAPAGYFTLAPTGTIQQVNLTGAHLVGIERSLLVGRSFAQLVSAAHRPAFNAFLKRVFAGEAKPSVDLELPGAGRPLPVVRVSAKRSPTGLDCRAVVVDITEQIRAEATRRRLEVVAATNRKLESEIARRLQIGRTSVRRILAADSSKK